MVNTSVSMYLRAHANCRAAQCNLCAYRRVKMLSSRALRGAVMALLAAGGGGVGLAPMPPAAAQSAAPTEERAEARAAYAAALGAFKAILAERRAQIEAKQRLPERPGQ